MLLFFPPPAPATPRELPLAIRRRAFTLNVLTRSVVKFVAFPATCTLHPVLRTAQLPPRSQECNTLPFPQEAEPEIDTAC